MTRLKQQADKSVFLWLVHWLYFNYTDKRDLYKGRFYAVFL